MSADPTSMKMLREPADQTRARGKPLIEGFKVHRVGLEIEDWVDERTWYEFGKLLQQMDYAWEWMVADWLAFGDHKYGDKVYAAASRIFGKAARTWEDYAYIARNVKISERSEILPVLTHKPVARFANDTKLQRTLLGLARPDAEPGRDREPLRRCRQRPRWRTPGEPVERACDDPLCL